MFGKAASGSFWHKMWDGKNPRCDDRIVKISKINALYELDMAPATFGNHLSNVLAAFFRILADKSFKMEKRECINEFSGLVGR